jgi:hypothetical protein
MALQNLEYYATRHVVERLGEGLPGYGDVLEIREL